MFGSYDSLLTSAKRPPKRIEPQKKEGFGLSSVVSTVRNRTIRDESVSSNDSAPRKNVYMHLNVKAADVKPNTGEQIYHHFDVKRRRRKTRNVKSKTATN